mgnify:FL=1
MALDPAYVVRAEHNYEFLKTFDLDKTAYLDWAVTVAFYVAVRYVDAHFAPERPGDHSNRNGWVRTRKNTRPIYESYMELYNQSKEARYELTEFTAANVKSLMNDLSRVRNHMKRQ